MQPPQCNCRSASLLFVGLVQTASCITLQGLISHAACPPASTTQPPAHLPRPLLNLNLEPTPHPAELGTGEVVVLMADEAVAAAWENSAAARDELAASAPAPIIRRAVALGRQLLDPLAVLASLCGGGGGIKAGKEVLALALHPLQAQVGRGCSALWGAGARLAAGGPAQAVGWPGGAAASGCDAFHQQSTARAGRVPLGPPNHKRGRVLPPPPDKGPAAAAMACHLSTKF